MPSPWTPQFLFAVCQCGAELPLKQEIANGPAGARPAFSRPGFVTFKLDTACQSPEQFQLPATFARSFGFSLGKVETKTALPVEQKLDKRLTDEAALPSPSPSLQGRGIFAGELAKQVWALPDVKNFLAAHEIADLHVLQRDTAPPGTRGFEPGPTELALAIEQTVRAHSPIENLQAMPKSPRSPSRRNRWVLDVVLVEPGQWWIGCHRTTRRTDCWPGGVVPLTLPEHAVSRAYLKMQEALHWSALPTTRGDKCVELGCAPGGASQALLEYGLTVLGVDPAEVAPEVTEHPHFTHIRRRSVDVPYKQLQGVQWLTADMNVAPNYTLDAVEQVVANKQANVRGMILTLKLADWKLAAELPQLVERVRSWGYRDIRTRQLAFNRQEICLVALRSRGQRRVKRGSRRKIRHDAAHASNPSKPHLSQNR